VSRACTMSRGLATGAAMPEAGHTGGSFPVLLPNSGAVQGKLTQLQASLSWCGHTGAAHAPGCSLEEGISE